MSEALNLMTHLPLKAGHFCIAISEARWQLCRQYECLRKF